MSTRGPYTAEEMIFYLLQSIEYAQLAFPLSKAQIADHKEPEIH
jgi:hypothetical protein